MDTSQHTGETELSKLSIWLLPERIIASKLIFISLQITSRK